MFDRDKDKNEPNKVPTENENILQMQPQKRGKMQHKIQSGLKES